MWNALPSEAVNASTLEQFLAMLSITFQLL